MVTNWDQYTDQSSTVAVEQAPAPTANTPPAVGEPQAQTANTAPTNWDQYTDQYSAPITTPAGEEPSSWDAVKGGFNDAAANVVGTATGYKKLSTGLLGPTTEQKTAMEAHPYLSLTGKVAGYVAPAAALTGLIGKAVAPVLGRGFMNLAAANTIASAILAGPDERIKGGVIGLATSMVSPFITAPSKFLANAATIGTKVKDTVGAITSSLKESADTLVAKSQANMWKVTEAVENKLFDAFRSVKGTVNAEPIAYRASQFLNQNIDELVPAQQKAVTDLIINSSKAKNLAELHDARKIFSYDYNKFSEGKPLSAGAFEQFQRLNKDITSVLKNNAESLGVGKEFAVANKFHQEKALPLINTGAKDTADILDAAAQDPLAAAKLTDTLINKFVKLDKPETTKAFLDTLDDVGRQAVEVKLIQNTLNAAKDATGQTDYLILKEGIKNLRASATPIVSEKSGKLLQGLENSINDATKLGEMTLDLAKVGTTSKLYAGVAALTGLAYATSPAVALGTGALAIGLSKVIGTPIGQRILIGAASPAGRAVGASLVNGLIMQGLLSNIIPSHLPPSTLPQGNIPDVNVIPNGGR